MAGSVENDPKLPLTCIPLFAKFDTQTGHMTPIGWGHMTSYIGRRKLLTVLSVTLGRQTRSCVPVCASLPINGAGSAIDGSTSCCETMVSPSMVP
jgi:hypothetical protein